MAAWVIPAALRCLLQLLSVTWCDCFGRHFSRLQALLSPVALRKSWQEAVGDAHLVAPQVSVGGHTDRQTERKTDTDRQTGWHAACWHWLSLLKPEAEEKIHLLLLFLKGSLLALYWYLYLNIEQKIRSSYTTEILQTNVDEGYIEIRNPELN